MKLFSSDRFVLPLPPTHTFPTSQYRLLRERVTCGAWPCSSGGKGRRLAFATKGGR